MGKFMDIEMNLFETKEEKKVHQVWLTFTGFFSHHAY